MNMYNGMEIHENSWLTEAGEPVEVRRSILERLFTRPWRPFKSHKTIIPQVPSRQITVAGNKLIMHPAMAIELKQTINKIND